MTKRLIGYRFPGILPMVVILTLTIGAILGGFARASQIGAAPVAVPPSASPSSATPAEATPLASPVASPIAGDLRDNAAQSLTAQVPALLANDPGVFGILVADTDGTPIYEHNADLPFITASLYKLPLMAQIYAMIGAGQITLDQEIILDESFYPYWDEGDSYYGFDAIGYPTTVEEALFATGAYSSNVGAYALASLTTWYDINLMAQSLGMTATTLVVYPSMLVPWPPAPGASDDVAAMSQAVTFIEGQALEGPVMITTPRDIAHFFTLLLSGGVVSPDASAGITAILAQQMVDDRFPMLLPDNTELIHKTGNLTGIVHDAGVIFTPSGPVILAALSEDNFDDSVATWIIQELARTTYDALTPPEAATPTP